MIFTAQNITGVLKGSRDIEQGSEKPAWKFQKEISRQTWKHQFNVSNARIGLFFLTLHQSRLLLGSR